MLSIVRCDDVLTMNSGNRKVIWANKGDGLLLNEERKNSLMLELSHTSSSDESRVKI